jgi:hypothetical protein
VVGDNRIGEWRLSAAVDVLPIRRAVVDNSISALTDALAASADRRGRGVANRRDRSPPIAAGPGMPDGNSISPA